MSEPRMGEVTPTPENLEDQYYAEFQAAENREDEIRKEIDAVIGKNSDSAEAEMIALQTLAPQMDEAMAKSREAYKKWFDQIMKIEV